MVVESSLRTADATERALPFTVWCAGQLLGTSKLDAPSGHAGARTGFLKPSDAFPAIWTEIGPVVGEFREVASMLSSDLHGASSIRPPPGLTHEEAAHWIHQAVLAHPLTERVVAALARMDALHLEVRNPDGQAVPCTHVVVQELPVPGFIPPEIAAQAIADAATVDDDMTWPCYMVSVIDLAAVLPQREPMSDA
jgi:hypothetical protein